MKRVLNVLAMTVATALVLAFISCANEILDNPKSAATNQAKSSNAKPGESASGNKNTIVTNFGLQATHGKKDQITLNWNYINNAYIYRIYSSPTPYYENGKDSFVLEQEISAFMDIAVTDENGNKGTKRADRVSIDLTVDSGTKRYYRMEAYKKGGALIETSNVVMGTSLASPVMAITVKDTTAEVLWFMDNCSGDTYQSHVRYEISMYNDIEGKDLFAVKVVKGSDFTGDYSVTFDKIVAGYKYYYEVRAYLDTAMDEFESSGLLDKEAAKSIIPSGVTNLTVTKGVYSKEIRVSWELPPFVNVRDGQNMVLRPVYFVLQRRVDTSEDGASDIDYSKEEAGWDTVASYIGTQRSLSKEQYKDAKNIVPLDTKRTKTEDVSKNWFFNCEIGAESPYDSTDKVAGDGECYVSCGDGSTKDEREAKSHLIVKRVSEKDYNSDMNTESYPRYVYGSKITYVDKVDPKGVTRNNKYIYRVISKTDDPNKTVIGPEKPYETGWALAASTFSGDSDNNAAADEAHIDGERDITTWNVELNLALDTRGVDYKYLLIRQCTPIKDDAGLGAASEGTPGTWEYVDCVKDGCKDSGHLQRALFDSVNMFNSSDSTIRDSGFKSCYKKEYKVADFTGAAGYGDMAYIDYKIVILSGAVTAENIATNIGDIITAVGNGDWSTSITDWSADKYIVDIVGCDNTACIVNSEKYLPKINYFTAETGYNDKFVFYIDYNKNYTYYVNYQDCHLGQVTTGDWVKCQIAKDAYDSALDTTKIKADDGVIPTFEETIRNSINVMKLTFSANKGLERKYEFVVKSGVTIRKTFFEEGSYGDNTKTLPIVETLGDVAAAQEDYYYDRVILKWPYTPGTKSKNDFEVYMYYDGDAETAENNIAVNKEVTSSGEGVSVKYTCTVGKPAGYNDATRAGKKIKTKIIAKSAKYQSTTQDGVTTSYTDSYILGPMALNVKVAAPSNTVMTTQWMPFPSDLIDKYVIYRVAYSDVAAKTFDTSKLITGDINSYTASIAYVLKKDANNNYRVTSLDSDFDVSYATSAAYRNGVIELIDTYVDSAGSSGSLYNYRMGQRRLAMGLPYAYFIMPVIDEADASFITKEDEVSATFKNDEHGSVTYSALNGAALTINATLGCGLDVKAAKLESAEKIVVTWDAPYWVATATQRPATLDNDYNRPIIFRKRCGGSNWTGMDGVRATVSYGDELNNLGRDEASDSAYEYAVVYGCKATSTKYITAAYTQYLSDNKEVSLKNADDEAVGEARYYYKDADEIEPKNKGYLLKLPEGFLQVVATASADSTWYDEKIHYYSEYVRLGTWDFDRRALCPPELSIGIKNYNIDNKFHDVWKFVYDNTSETYSLKKVDDDASAAEGADLCDVYATSTFDGRTYGDRLWLTPKTIYESSGSTGAKIISYDCANKSYNTKSTGVLKVLRDYKHYYRVSAINPKKGTRDALPSLFTRNNPNAEEIRRRDVNMYAYRNITDEELVKATMLCVAQGIQDTGLNKDGGTSVDWKTAKGFNEFTNSEEGSIRCAYKGAFFEGGTEMFKMDTENYIQRWTKMPAGNITTYSPFKLYDHDGEDHNRGHRYSNNIHYISYGFGGRGDGGSLGMSKLIPLHVTGTIALESYNATVNYNVGVKRFNVKVTHDGENNIATFAFSTTDENTRRAWMPAELWDGNYTTLERKGTYYGNDADYGWWGISTQQQWESSMGN